MTDRSTDEQVEAALATLDQPAGPANLPAAPADQCPRQGRPPDWIPRSTCAYRLAILSALPRKARSSSADAADELTTQSARSAARKSPKRTLRD
jgi:hypothetical protein